MKQNMYTIYDTVADVFNKPFLSVNDKDATRAFVQSFTSNEQANKDDYVLYSIGTFNNSNGDLEPVVPRKIYSGLDIKEAA